MSEPWLRDAVSGHVLGVLDAMESRLRSLNGASSDAEPLKQLSEEARLVASSCFTIQDFDRMVPTLEGFDRVLGALQDGRLELGTRVRALLLQSVQTFRHGVKNLGLGTRTADLLPKLLQDISQVYEKLLTQRAIQKKPIPTTPGESYYLTIVVSGTRYLVPCTQVSKVLCRPPSTRSPGHGQLGWRSVFDAGDLIPLLENGSEELHWVVVFHSDEASSNVPTFCLPVDGLGEILQVSADAEASLSSAASKNSGATVLDIQTLFSQVRQAGVA